MASIPTWVKKHPYTQADLDFIAKEQETRFVYDSDVYGDWLIARTKEFMKGTFLEQDLVPFERRMSPRCFGYEVGPSYSFEDGTLHEIAHAIQLKKNQYNTRVKQAYNRFRQPRSSSQIVMGEVYYEPKTMEIGVVEAEAFAIQAILLERLGYELELTEFFHDAAGVLTKYTPDWYKGGSNKAARIATRVKFMEAFYDMWNDQHEIMEVRYRNYCNYVHKLRKVEADANDQ